MPGQEAPCVELGSAPQTPSIGPSPSPSEISSTSTPEPHNLRPTPLFRALALPPPEPAQPAGQEELERRLPGYRRIVIPRDLTLIELLKQSSGAQTDEEVLRIREAKLRVIADQVGLRRLPVLAPRLRELSLDGSAVASLRDLGVGLARLKILSINRCGLTSLDGVWGLGALRELHAAGNQIRDLQPLAGLQKLHTLNLADNPIAESSRLWTLGVCDRLRHLKLHGTPLADAEDYRARVEAALSMLSYLDDRPMHEEGSLEAELNPHLSSDSESECEVDTTATSMTPDISLAPQPGPSQSIFESVVPETETDVAPRVRRRPATTECAGARPRAPRPPRPATARVAGAASRAPSRLHALNTLMDEEWRCSGSRLTSQQPVCGNIARALRRPFSARQALLAEEEKLLLGQTLEEASRSIAKEIPCAPRLEDWAEFRKLTGIDINIDFDARPHQGDAATALDRLEKIEQETLDRLKEEALKEAIDLNIASTSAASFDVRLPSGCDAWSGSGSGSGSGAGEPVPRPDSRLEVDVLFKDIIAMGIESQQ